MNQEIERYYQKIDVMIATITDLAEQIIKESAKGTTADHDKIAQFQCGLKFILGTKSAVEAIATLVKIQAKLAEFIEPTTNYLFSDEQNLQTTYLYFVARYEEECSRFQKCAKCGTEQKLIDEIISGKASMTFSEFLKKITNK